MTLLSDKIESLTFCSNSPKKLFKRIAVLLPCLYRGGTLKGAQNIAKMLHLGSRKNGEPVEVVFSCLAGTYLIEETFSELLTLGIAVRETKWEKVSRQEIEFLAKFYQINKPLSHPHYCLPNDGISYFGDCDFWLLVSDRTSYPLIPAMPYANLVYDYLQRYIPELTFSDDSFLATTRGAQFVLTTTPHTLQDTIQYAGVNPNKTFLSPMEFKTPAPPSSCCSLPEKPYFVWVTNTTQHKNHERALRALSRYFQTGGNLDCVMLGPGIEKYRSFSSDWQEPYISHITHKIEQIPELKRRLRIVGEVSDEEYSAYLAHARFLWHPTLVDNGTFTVLEAAYLNTPSLSSDYPAMRYINETFGLHLAFFNPFDPCQMAQHLQRMEQEASAKKKLLPKPNYLEAFTPEQLSASFWLNFKNCYLKSIQL